MATVAPTPAAGWRHRAVPAHTRTLVLGLSLISGSLLFTMIAGLATGVPFSDAAFLVPFVVLPALAAVLAWRFGTWARALGIVIALGVAAMTFFFAFGLTYPASFVEFTAATAYVLGVVLTLYGGIASIVRRNELHAEAARSEILLDRTALGLVVLALVVSLPLWLTGRETLAEGAGDGLTTVAAANFHYDDVTVAAGDSIVVRNEDPFFHTFTIDELGIDVELLPGSAVVVDLPDAAGTYTYYCIPHSFEAGEAEDDMAATLTIE